MGELQIRYSDKSVSPWGGMYLLKEFMDRSGIFSKLEELDLPRPGSNAGYSPIEILQGFWLGLFVGASRYVHLEWLRGDETLKEIFNLECSEKLKSFLFVILNLIQNPRFCGHLKPWIPGQAQNDSGFSEPSSSSFSLPIDLQPFLS